MNTYNLIFSIGDTGDKELYEETIKERYKHVNNENNFFHENEYDARLFDVEMMIKKLKHEQELLKKHYNAKIKYY